MKPVTMSVEIAARPALVWRTITDFADAARIIPAIRSVEILEGPPHGLGMRWRETRVMFGRDATETMEIAEWREPAAPGDSGWYLATATNHGCEYRSTMRVDASGVGSRLSFVCDCQTKTFGAKAMATLMLPIMGGMVRKALRADLDAIKSYCEREASAAAPAGVRA